MACGGIVDHCEIEGEDRFWITPYRLPALVGTPSTHENCTKKVMYNAQRGEQLTGALGDYREVEKCYYKDGPSGKVNHFVRRIVWALVLKDSDPFMNGSSHS